MKTSCCFVLAIAAALTSLGSSQESSGTPDKRPTIDPNSPDVQSSLTYDLGDRLLTIQEVTETTLPPPPPPPIAQPSPLPTRLETARFMVEQAKRRYLSMSGKVYRQTNGPSRSLITCYQRDEKGPVVFWSSIDWNLLTPGFFEFPDGKKCSLMLMLITVDDVILRRFRATGSANYNIPNIPAFPSGAASFQIVSGQATPQLLEDLIALHAIHDRDHAALLAAWNEREAARLKAEADKPAIPPAPEDIVLQYRMLKPEEIQTK